MANTRKLELEIVADASSVKGEMRDAAKAVDKFEDSVDQADGTASRLSGGLGNLGDRADTGEQRIMGMKDSVDGLSTVMMGPGEQGIAAYLQGWADLSSGVANFVIPSLKRVVDSIAGTAVEAAKSAASVAKSVALQIANWVRLGVQSMLHAAKVAAAWLISMGPIAIVGAAVVGLVALIIANWEHVSKFLKAVWEGIKDVAAKVWEGIQNAIGAVVDAIVFMFQNFTLPGLILKHWNTIKSITTAAWNFVRNAVSGAVTAIVGFFTALPGRIASALGQLGNRIWAAFSAGISWAKNQIGGAITGVVDMFVGIPQRVFDGLAEIGNKIWAAFRDGINFAKTEIAEKLTSLVDFFTNLPGRVGGALGGIAETIKSPFTTAFNAIKSLWNSTVGGFGFTVPSWVPGLGGKGFRIPNMAVGGIVPGQFGTPQMILAHAGEMVLNPRQQAAAFGQQPIVLNVYLDGDDVSGLVRTKLIRVGNRNQGRIFAAS